MKKLPTSSFNSKDYPLEDRLAAFQQMTASVYHATALGNERDFMVDTSGYFVNHLMFHSFNCTNARFSRTQQHLQGSNADFLVLHAQLSGEELLQMEHGIIRLVPGYIYLRDWAYLFDSQTTRMTIRGVMIPRRQLTFGKLFNVHNPIMSWSMDEPKGAMLWKLWSQLFDELAQLDEDTAQHLSQGFLGFLNGMVGTGDIEEYRGDKKLNLMERHIQAQLRGDVTVASLCQYFCVSRATVFRLFKPHGGLQHYVDRLRLERCYSELKSSDPQQITIGEIAAGWGYNDPKSFNRKFRNQFGLPPSKILGSGFTQNKPAHKNKRSINDQGKPYINFKRWMAEASGRIIKDNEH